MGIGDIVGLSYFGDMSWFSCIRPRRKDAGKVEIDNGMVIVPIYALSLSLSYIILRSDFKESSMFWDL